MSRPVVRAALVAGLVSQGCVPERAFVGVDAVKTDAGVLVLVSRAESFSIWRAGDEWVKLSERAGRARACAWHEGRLWVFHRRSISTYAVSEDAIERTGSAGKPFDWPVRAADSDGRLWVCGLHEGSVRAGVLRSDGWAELPPGPEVSERGYMDILAEGRAARVAFFHDGGLVLRVDSDGGWETLMSLPTAARAVALAPGGRIFIQAKYRPATYEIVCGRTGENGLAPLSLARQRSVFNFGWALSAPGEFLFSSNSSELRAYAREGERWRELTVPDELRRTPAEVRVAELLVVLGLATATGVLVFVARLRKFLQGVREPPNVAVAPWAIRGLAWAIDSGAVLLASGALALALFGRALFELEYDDPRIYAVSLSWHGVSCIYCLVFDLVWGATPGKKLVALEVVMEDGSGLTASAALVRNLVRVIDQYPFPVTPVVGLASMMLTSKQQRLGDLVAGTVVARRRKK